LFDYETFAYVKSIGFDSAVILFSLSASAELPGALSLDERVAVREMLVSVIERNCFTKEEVVAMCKEMKEEMEAINLENRVYFRLNEIENTRFSKFIAFTYSFISLRIAAASSLVK
jgi:hypothetical protein